MHVRRSLALLVLACLAGPAMAGPVEDLLRAAPPDAAFVLVVRDARSQVANLKQSPFAAAFPATPLGQRLLDSPDLRKLQTSIDFICAQTDTPSAVLLDDILGDAIVFSLLPGTGGDSKQDRSLLLIRPAKPAALERFVDKLNALQTGSGEITAITAHNHQGKPYTERKKTVGPDFYASRDGIFAYSNSEAEIRAFLERGAKLSAFEDSIAKLGLDTTAAVLLVNPRALDAEMQAKIAAGKPAEQAFLTWFAGQWKKLDTAAIYLRLEKSAELGLAIRPRDGETLVGPAVASRLWSSIPDDAILAFAGQQKLSELVDSIQQLLPEDGRRALRAVVDQALVPVIGKDKLPIVVDALGPNWAVWTEAPREEGFLPSTIFALEVQAGPKQAEASRAIAGALQYLFQTARVMHNARGGESIELVEETDGNVVIRSLVGEKSFPPSVSPSFAMKDDYLLLASDPAAIRRFRKPIEPAAGAPEVMLARFSATALRSYLRVHGTALAGFVAGRTGTPLPQVEQGLGSLGLVLEPIERVDVISRTTGSTLHFAIRLTPTKSLK